MQRKNLFSIISFCFQRARRANSNAGTESASTEASIATAFRIVETNRTNMDVVSIDLRSLFKVPYRKSRGIVRVKKKQKKKEKNRSQRCLVPVKNTFCSSNRSNRVLIIYHICVYYVFVRNSSSWLRYGDVKSSPLNARTYDTRPIWSRDAATRAPTTESRLLVRANAQIFHS